MIFDQLPPHYDLSSTFMAIRAGTCPVCSERLPSSTGLIPPGCPFAGETGCALAEEHRAAEGGPLAETIAYPTPAADEADDDGFPEVDDLANRTVALYRMGQVIGRGMMGRVYQAEHRGLARPCAIKIMNPSLVRREPATVERFWAEARAVAGLVHPHVVTVHNLGTERGYHYIEMEYMPGGVSLKETLVRAGPLDPARASKLMRQVALGLEAAHRAGLVHRDVKPANVLMTADGRAKLADFGLVRKIVDVDRNPAGLAGTPTFMAPELFGGRPAGPKTDLYAVGVMYYYLLTARLPFASDNLARLILLHRNAPVPDVRLLAPAAPSEVTRILGRLLAKNPADRYDSAGELAEDLFRTLGQLRNTEQLVHESLEGLDCLIQGGRDRWRVVYPVPGDRIHEVYIELVEGRRHERLLTVFSVCAPCDPRHYEFALKLNNELTHGSLSIREVNGQAMFVMTRTFAHGHVGPAEIRAAVQEIAKRGDRVEQQLTSTDVF
jgi:serine/threonine-protein kinase